MEAGGRPGKQAGAGGLHLTSIHLAHWVDVNHKPDLIPFQILGGAEKGPAVASCELLGMF